MAGAASVGVFVSFASLLVYTFGMFLKPLAEEFSWSREAVSAAFGIAAMTVAVCSPPLGLLLDRLRRAAHHRAGLAIFGGAFASLALLTPHLWHLYAVFVVLGIVGNGTAQMAYTRAVSSWFEKRRGAALALMMSGSAVGAMVLPPIAQALIDAVGWRTAYALLGGMVLVVGLPGVLAFVRERPSTAAARATTQRRRHRTRGPGQPRVLDSDRGPLLQLDCAERSDHAPVGAAHGSRRVSAAGAAAGGSRRWAVPHSQAGSLTGWLLDRFFAARVSFALLRPRPSARALLSWANSLPLGVAGAALIGFGMGGEGDVTPYLLSRYFGLRSFSTLYGLTWTAYAIAGAIGPILMGQAFDVSGSYEALLLRLAIATLAVAGLMLFLPRYETAQVTDGTPRAAAYHT